MSATLRFSLPETLALADHALAAPHAQPTFYEQEQRVACTGALAWVKDDGTYLMSGGEPRLPADTADPHGPARVVYAEGWGPGASHDLLAAHLGGDDFVEHLHLREGNPPLIDQMREAHRRGYRWLVIVVHRDTFQVGFAGAPPSPPQPGCSP